jgi:hypothetical protein
MPGALPTGIDQVDLQPGSHVCAFYRGDDDRDRFSGEVVVNIVKTHPQVLIQGILVENPYYVRPDEYLRSAHA